VRVIVLMFFQQPVADGPTVVLPGAATAAALALGATVTVVLGLVPQPLLDLVTQAGALVR
jgi:NADH-quinone oxidoreductase subunit N